MLLISGTGRKSGKTTLACKLLRKFSKNGPVIGLKISSHLHEPGNGLSVVKSDDTYIIFEENVASSNKDTSRMLSAGAIKSYYIQTKEHGLYNAIHSFLEIVSNDFPIICESPALYSIISPGLYIVCHRKGMMNPKKGVLEKLEYADLTFCFSGSFTDDEISSIYLSGTHWSIEESGLKPVKNFL